MALINWAGWIVLLTSGIVLFLVAWRFKLRWWPSLLLRVIVLLAVGLAFDSSLDLGNVLEYEPEILILDRSDSISEESLFSSQVFANVWKTLRPNRQVIVFGSSSDYILSEQWPDVSTKASDFAGALQLTSVLLNGHPGRVIVASDGLVDDPIKVDEWIEKMKLSGIDTDFILLDRVKYNSDVSVGEIRGVTSVWSKIRFPVFLPVNSHGIEDAILQVFINGQMYKETRVKLQEGESILPLILPAGDPGVMNIESRLVVDGDQFIGNNASYASIQVFEQPKILIITNNDNVTENLAKKLEEAFSQVVVISPENFPTSIEEIKTFQVIIVHDVLAQDFNFEQMQALKLHVLELGRGLIFLGGRNSYTLGGYQNTILEPLIPVILAPPDRVQRVPITFLLVLDRSGSMAGDRNTEIAPIDLTREAAMRAIETLRSDDYLGVLTFSGDTEWDVEIRKVGEGLDLRNAQDKVSQIVAIGGTFMYQALEEAIDQMIVTDATDYPHILLMSDGVSGDGSMDEFIRLVRFAKNNGITISTIALGPESDPETLSSIARTGGGRFYQVNDPADLPRVMISESRAVQAENVQEGRTNLILGVENHPILAGFSLDELPLLDSYIATQSKSSVGAEDVLLSGNFGDPLLSVWQVGLGHVAAWMGDLGEQWTPSMRDWEKLGIFWQQVARYTLPDPDLIESDVQLKVEGTQTVVELSLNENEMGLVSQPPKWIQTNVEPQVRAYPMTQVSAGVFQVVLPAAQEGAYTGIVQYSVAGKIKNIVVPFAVNYPKEWRFDDPEIGKTRLYSWLSKSGGSMLSFDLELENSAKVNVRSGSNWFVIGLVFLMISWPAEIAIRRWQMPWRRP